MHRWTPPTHIRVDRTSYRVRLNERGTLEVWIGDAWRTQSEFAAYDDDSARMIAENLVHRHARRTA
jgi:hypothetical protein